MPASATTRSVVEKRRLEVIGLMSDGLQHGIAEVMETLGLTHGQARLVLSGLVREGRLTMHGTKKGAKYALAATRVSA